MSEEKEKNLNEEGKEPVKTDVIEDSYAVLRSKVIAYEEQIEEQKLLIDELSKKLSKANDILEERVKGELIAKIAPKTSIHPSVLAAQPLEELKKMDRILVTAKIPAFKSGTPIKTADKSPEAKLKNMFGDYMREIGVSK